jgi:hypothetical protein
MPHWRIPVLSVRPLAMQGAPRLTKSRCPAAVKTKAPPAKPATPRRSPNRHQGGIILSLVNFPFPLPLQIDTGEAVLDVHQLLNLAHETLCLKTVSMPTTDIFLLALPAKLIFDDSFSCVAAKESKYPRDAHAEAISCSGTFRRRNLGRVANPPR